MMYKWKFLSHVSILRDKWRQPATSTLLDENLTCEFKRKNSFTLSKSCMKTEQFLLTVKSSLYPKLNTEELDHKAKENSLACGLDAAFLPNIFRVVEKLWAVFNAEKKLLNSAQVALTKIPRNEVQIYQKTDFLSSKGHLLTSPGCCRPLTSSLDVEQLRFASWSAYRVLLGNDLSNLSAASVLSQKYNACTFRLEK